MSDDRREVGPPVIEVVMDDRTQALSGARNASAANSAPAHGAADHGKFVHHAGSPWFLALTALGVVFGDIGTSPLYAFQVALSGLGHAPAAADVLGIVSLILWALMAMVILASVATIIASHALISGVISPLRRSDERRGGADGGPRPSPV